MSIENPVRRADGTVVPIELIKGVSRYCREHDYKLHLDGARLHIASAYSGVSISDYAANFDTVYISLYKYLNATRGAMLCGDAEIIDQLDHQIKILGGTMYQTWPQTAMALHYLKGIEDRWKQVVIKSEELLGELENLKGVSVHRIKHGSNISFVKLDEKINSQAFVENMSKKFQIGLRSPDQEGRIRLAMNESVLSRANMEIITAWKTAMS